MIDQLKEEMEGVQEYLIDNSIFTMEEQFDLIQKTFIFAAKTRQKEKLKLIRKDFERICFKKVVKTGAQ